MLKLEDIKRGSQIDGLVPNAIATISVAEMASYNLDDISVKKEFAKLLQKAVKPEGTL